MREELAREYKSLLSILGEVQTVAGETELLSQTKRVLALSAKCIDIMGKGKPTKPIAPPKYGRENMGKYRKLKKFIKVLKNYWLPRVATLGRLGPPRRFY